MQTLIQDLRYGIRMLAKNPGFTLAAALTLAIGIGATTTVFTLVDAIIIKPLPYPDSDRLVAVHHAAPGLKMLQTGMSDGTYLHYREHHHVFEEIGTYYENVVNLSDAGELEPERVPIAMVSHTFFSVLGARTILGHLPTEEDLRGGQKGDVVVLISHDLWKRRYGSDPGIIGRVIEANRAPRRVIGVLEPGFEFPRREIAIWYPSSDPDPAETRASDFFQDGIARLKPDVTPEDAERDLNRLIPSLPQAYPDLTAQVIEESRLRSVVVPLKDFVVGETRTTLWLLFGGMAFLLLIACANVANLFLVRCEHRQKEVVVRTALGAAGGDLARAFAAESAIIVGLGGIVGLGFADAGVRALVAFGPGNLPRLHEVGIDERVVGFTVALSVVTAVLFTLVPLIRSARLNLITVLKEGGSGSTFGPERQRVRRVLVSAQVALALTLLVGSGLMIQSFWGLKNADAGFDPEDVITVEIALPYRGYETYEQAYDLWDRLLERVRALPGVEAAGAVSGLPLVPQPAYYDLKLEIEGRPDETRAAMTVYSVTPGYFETMRIGVLEGQTLGSRELSESRPALVSAAAARRLFPGESVVGQRVRRGVGRDRPWLTVVGVVGDVPKQHIGGDTAEILYLPVLEQSVDEGWKPSSMTLVARTSLPPASLTPAIRQIAQELDPNLPLANVRTMDLVVAHSMARTSFTMLLLLVAAAAALFLGAIGVYGVISYAVSRRTHEIGIHVALGAGKADVQRLILADAARIVWAGIAIGIAGALVLTRFLRGLLYEVSPTDPATITAVSLLLAGVALLACLVPARRATRVDPMVALRYE